MAQLTKAQYDRLIPLEQHLQRAVKGNYVYNMTKDEAQQLFDIYNVVFGKNEKSIGCTRCRLNVAKLLGNLYFQYQQKNNIQKQKRNGKTKKTTKEL